MAENLNTLYYALDLDDVKMQQKLDKDINDLSRLDDEFNKINATISKTFGQKFNIPIHNDIKQLVGELKTLASEWDALNIAQKRGVEGGNITSNYEKLSVKINELGKSLATLYNESIRNAKAQERLVAAQEKAEKAAMDKYYASLAKEEEAFTKAQEKAIISSEKLAKAQEKQISKQRAGEFKEYIQSLTKQSDISKQMSAYYKSLERQTAKAAAEQEKMANAQKRVANEVRKVNNEFTLQSRVLSNLKTLFTTYISIFAIKSFIQNLAQVRGEFENQQIALRAILRDAEAADKIFGQIKSFAVISPFEFKDLVGYAKQLSAFQVPVNELFETTKRLADVSAGLGVGMDRIILAYGQVRSAAVLRGQELRQFTEAGIPLVDELAKKFSELEGRVVSAGDVFEKISNRMVSFEMVKEIFEDMTNEGGMFYMMQEKQAESLKGKISNLADAYDIMLNDIGQANDGILKGGVEGIAALFENWQKVWSILKTLIIGYGAYKTAIILATVAEKAHIALGTSGSLLKTAKNLGIVISNLGRFQAALRATGMSARSFGAAIGGIIGILGAIGVAIYEVIKNSNKLSNELNKISRDEFSGFRKMSDSLENLAEKLKNTVQGSQEHRDIIRQINNAYGEYLPFILDEKTALDAVANSTEQVIEAMKKRKMMMAQQKGEEAIQDTYGAKNTKATTDLLDALSLVTNSRKDAEAIMQIVSRKIDELGTKVKIFEELQKAFTDYYEGEAPKELKLFDVYESVNDLQKITLNIKKAEEDLAAQNRITFGSSFNTRKAREELEKLEESFKAMRENIGLEGDTTELGVKNAIDEINKNEKIAKIRWRVEFDGLSQDEANRLIYQIEHPLSKVIEEVNKELENQIKNQKELDFIKIKDPGKSLDEIKQETIAQFQGAQKILEGLLETQKQWEGNEAVSNSMKKDIEWTQRQIELYKERARLLGITDKLQEGGGKDPNAERLKEQIDLIKKAQAQYEKYLQIMSPDEALNAIRTDKQFMALDIQFEPDKVRERLQIVMNDIGKLPQSPELEKLKKSIQSTFTDIDYTDAKKNFDKFLSDLTKELDTYKDKYNFYEQLLGITGDQDLAVRLAFNGDFEKAGKGIIEQIQQGMLDAAKGSDLSLDQIMNLDFTKSADELGISEKLKDFLQKSVDQIGKIQLGNVLDFEKLVAEYSSVEDKIKAIQNRASAERIKISETYERQRINANADTYLALEDQELAALSASKQREDKAIRDLMSEMLQLTPFWQKLFGDLDELGYRSLTELSDKAKEVVDSAEVNKDKDGKVLGYTVEYDEKSYDISVELFEKLRKQTNSLDKDLKKSNPFKTLFEDLKEGPKEGEKFGDFAKRISNSLVGIIGIANEVGGSLSGMLAALGDEDSAQAIDFVMQLGDAFGTLLSDLSSGNPVQMIGGIINGVAKVVTLFSEKHDNKLEKQIKNSELALKKLKYAYEDLDRVISKALGEQKYSYTQEQIKNLQEQQKELLYQAEKERQKKKSDKGKIQDLKREVIELNYAIEDLLNNLKDEIIGSTAADVAKQLGDAFFEAFAAGEDAAIAWGNTVNDIIGNVVKNMLISKFIEAPVQEAIDKLYADIMPDAVRAEEINKQIEEARKELEDIQSGKSNFTDKVKQKDRVKKLNDTIDMLQKQLASIQVGGPLLSGEAFNEFENVLGMVGDDFQKIIDALPDDIKKYLLGGEGGEGLSKGIKGITEDTALLLASYLNAIRGSVLLQELYMKNIDTNVAGIYQAMGGSPNITTTTTIPPEIISAISEPFKQSNSLLTRIDANMANVHSISANALAQLVLIQANTYNTAMATREAVEELRGVISPGHPKGGNGIKVWA